MQTCKTRRSAVCLLPLICLVVGSLPIVLTSCGGNGSPTGNTGGKPPTKNRVTPRALPTKLLFLSNRPGGLNDKNYDIYEAKLDGSGVAQVTDIPNVSIRWFDMDPTQERLVMAYSSDGDLSIGPSGGHGGAEGGEQVIATLVRSQAPKVLLDIRPKGFNPPKFVGMWHPTFAPDGKRIVFSATRKGESANLWLINADGTALRKLVDDPQRTYNDPRWGPDGRIVYVRHDSQGIGQLANPDGLDVWVMDPDDPKSAQRVAREAVIPGTARIETDPAMSPDGCFVASIRATRAIGLGTILRPLSDNVAFPLGGAPTDVVRTMQTGEKPDRVHGVPTWQDVDTLLSYRWESKAKGWRVIRFDLDAKDGDVEVLDLGAPVGSEDLMPLAY